MQPGCHGTQYVDPAGPVSDLPAPSSQVLKLKAYTTRLAKFHFKLTFKYCICVCMCLWCVYSISVHVYVCTLLLLIFCGLILFMKYIECEFDS